MSNKYLHKEKHLAFLQSALTHEGSLIKLTSFIQWLTDQNKKTRVKVNKTLFSKLNDWAFNDAKGTLNHKTGRFFSIEGVRVHTNWGKLKCWEQPIINQPEVGFLGIITKEFDGVLHFLMQAKIEPGNLNNVQLSPTLQATKSNYTRVHNGKQPDYLDYFIHARPEQIMLDQLQSEQGARFLKKRNRNIIIKIDDNLEVRHGFAWLTLGQIKKLMQIDNMVNMDSRTVLSGISFTNVFKDDFTGLPDTIRPYSHSPQGAAFLKSAQANNDSVHKLDEILSIITAFKSNLFLNITKVPLNDLKDWIVEDEEIYHIHKKHFRVIPVDVEIGNREVFNWQQPMIQPLENGICAFVCKEINGIIHFAVHAKVECGNHDIMEFAPTVQCLLTKENTNDDSIPFLDYILNAPKEKIVFDTIQSEEGGRFYHEQNRNMLVLAGDELTVKLPAGYYWLSLNQLIYLLQFNNYINIQARSLIAAISFI